MGAAATSGDRQSKSFLVLFCKKELLSFLLLEPRAPAQVVPPAA